MCRVSSLYKWFNSSVKKNIYIELSPPNKGDDQLELQQRRVHRSSPRPLCLSDRWSAGHAVHKHCSSDLSSGDGNNKRDGVSCFSAAARLLSISASHISWNILLVCGAPWFFDFFIFSPRCFSPHYTADGTSEQMRFAPSVPQNVPVSHARIIQFSALHQLSAGGPRGVPLHMHECTKRGQKHPRYTWN